eukprot:CAMPEP_0115327452 /NCGR_PEP_ID=MMETSP0270-20121206/84140_1 /TAXON_ID=71861 /ORGANISM="Scrippsiella trochoidea, Strain CCMP3099" /LENGTH=38 /DNA_ID= /DNA_START= /DNA_END= /DNA_ORIENTATION=
MKGIQMVTGALASPRPRASPPRPPPATAADVDDDAGAA